MNIHSLVAAAAVVGAVTGCSSATVNRPAALAAAAPLDLREPPYRWTTGIAPQAHKDMIAAFGKVGLKPGDFVWATTAPQTGESLMVVDLLTQMAYAYRGGTLVGASTISSARRGMVTPLGNWTVLEKHRFYRSKKYDNAPMPFMQRIDGYGIAFHGGSNPGYPASHGCVRLPMKFAEKLFGLTRIGSKVVIEG